MNVKHTALFLVLWLACQQAGAAITAQTVFPFQDASPSEWHIACHSSNETTHSPEPVDNDKKNTVAFMSMNNKDRNRTLDIVILTGSDARFIRPFLNSGLSIKGIIKCTSQPERENPHNLAVRVLKYLKRLFGGAENFERLEKDIERRGIDYRRVSYSDHKSLEAYLREMKPDVVAAYHLGILPLHLLTLPPHGFLNLHPSLLPRYRGGKPVQWMAYRFDRQGGATVHFMSEAVDRGDIVAQAPCEIILGSSERQVEQQIVFELGVELMIESLYALQNQTITRTAQPAASPTPYAKNLSHRQLWEMIDWQNWSLDHTWHMLRCAPFWVDYLPARKGWRRWCDWEIAGRKAVSHRFAIGEIKPTSAGYFIAHRQGIIEIKPRFRIKKMAKIALKYTQWRAP